MGFNETTITSAAMFGFLFLAFYGIVIVMERYEGQK